MKAVLCIVALLVAMCVSTAPACDIVVGGGFVQSGFGFQTFSQPVFAQQVFAPQFVSPFAFNSFGGFGQRQVFVQQGVCGSAFIQPQFVRQRAFVRRGFGVQFFGGF